MFRSLHWSAVLAFSASALTGCSSDQTSPFGTSAYIRIVNSSFQATDETYTTFVPMPVDILIDSSSAAPGIAAMAGNSMSNGTLGPGGNNAGYSAIAVGVRSFVARSSAVGADGPNLFTTSNTNDPSCTPLPYLPKQQLIPAIYYTFIVAGLNPVPTVIDGRTINTPAPSGIPFSTGCDVSQPAFSPISISTIDDPFSPPSVVVDGHSIFQMRFHVWNAAPFTGTSDGLGSPINVYLSDGSSDTPPTTFTSLRPLGIANYRQQSAYINATAMPYWLTMIAGGQIVYQTKINYQPGEVHSLIVQNTLPEGATTFPLDGSVDPQTYTKVTDIIDNKF